ncbi:MAG: hypothetical protein ACK5NA_04545 [Enterococcus sp.]
MTPRQRLDELPKEITQTFHKEFVFLFYPDKIQHFPARGWSHDQIIDELEQRLTEPLVFDSWQGHELVLSSNSFALIP